MTAINTSVLAFNNLGQLICKKPKVLWFKPKFVINRLSGRRLMNIRIFRADKEEPAPAKQFCKKVIATLVTMPQLSRMSAAAFNKYSIARTFKAGDSTRFGVNLKNERDEHIAAAMACSNSLDSIDEFNSFEIGRKDAVSYSDYPITLVLRALANNIKYRTQIRIPNRDNIIKSAIQASEDCTPMAIYRRDIASFYESIPLEPLKDQLLRRSLLSPKATFALEAFFEAHCKDQSFGLPRGLSISAILAELSMQSFDKNVRSQASVYRYFRFSDDILIFSNNLDANIDTSLNEFLPQGLRLNPKKHENVILDGSINGKKYVTFDYLGYAISLDKNVASRGNGPRCVNVSLASGKKKKIKSRVVLSLKKFQSDKDAGLLIDRLRFLTSNFSIKQTGINSKGRKQNIFSGIYFNYRLCKTVENDVSLPDYRHDLSELDGFMQSYLFGANSPFKATIFNNLTLIQRNMLQKLSFRRGYEVPMMTRFPSSRIERIKAAWSYVK